MFGFRPHAKRETVAVVDIDSGSAAVAIVALESGQPATILSYHRQSVSIAERSDEAIADTIAGALETAAREATDPAAPRPSAVYVFFHAPWARSQVVHAVQAYDHDIKITEAIIADTGKEAIRASGRDPRSFFETSVVRVELNGYPTAHPIGKMAHRVSASALTSIADPALLRRIDDALARAFPDTTRIVRSGARAQVAVSNDLSGRLGDTVIIEIGQEATSLLVVRRGVLDAEGLLSEGTNGILRRIGGSPEETLSTLHLIGKDLCDSATCESMNVSLARIEPDLVRLFGEAFAELVRARRLPNRLMLLTHPDMSHWLASFFARIDFSQFSVTSQPFDTVAIEPADIAHLVAADSKLEPDVSLLTAAACVHLEQRRA